MFCSHCGAKLPDDPQAGFCASCGAPIPGSSQQPVPSQIAVQPAPFRSPATRALWAQIPLALLIAASVFAAYADYHHAQVLQDIINGRFVSLTTANSADHLQQAANGVSGLLSLACAVTFIVWFYRCYVNLDPAERRYKTGWAGWSWFVPFLNLWRPKQLANDMVRSRLGAGVSADLVLWWWILWIAYGWVSNTATRTWFQANTPQANHDSDLVSVGSDLLAIPAAVLAILVIRAITEAQLRAQVAPQPPPAPAWPPPATPAV